MPHVSSEKLNPKLSEKLFLKLLSVLEKADRKNNMACFVNELFTPTEKTMLAKRLAIIIMLSGKTPQKKIAEVLKVSPTTVVKMSLFLEIGKYDNILYITKKEKLDLEKLVWQILTAGGIMPPIAGQKYWRTVSKR